MTGKTLDLENILNIDNMAVEVSNQYVQWDKAKAGVKERWIELNNYIYATDTRHTTNAKNPWSNTTTIPKLTQIRDNLHANYLATMFPKRKWLNWEGDREVDQNKDKVDKIKNYMFWAVSQPQFKSTVKKLLLDYIDKGNVFPTVQWVDKRVEDRGIKSGFVGPELVRIPPTDIVFNPLSTSFIDTPKIVRSLMTVGEAKEMLNRLDKTPEEEEIAQQVWHYLTDIRKQSMTWGGTEVKEQNHALQIDGFGSYREYLSSGYVEIITFYGDMYDMESDTLLKDHMIVVMDRHRVVLKKTNPYPLAETPIYHAGWRVRSDNLWAMGPLENLVGLQYRLDHIENMKSDLLDLITLPPILVKGEVSEFEYAPMEKIFTDVDGDVSIKAPDVNALQNNLEIASIESRMEEMAGSPKEAMGFRTPGEKTAYEVQRLENAASRIFQSKVAQFEEMVLEPCLNAMLVLAKTHLEEATVRSIDDEFGSIDFQDITKEDLSANGRLKPVAARNFAEKAERIQSITSWSQSPLGQDEDVKMHFSSIKLAELVEELTDIEEYGIVTPYIRLAERADAEKQAQALAEENQVQAQTPSGLTPEDTTGDFNVPEDTIEVDEGT